MTLLGIDYGGKRIGLALSDPQGNLARRFLTLRNNTGAIDELLRIAEENGVEGFVVGLPMGFRGESDQTRVVEVFVDELKKRTGLPVMTMNEILTSKMAQENLIAAGTKGIKEVLDQEAARIILQDYLDHRKPQE